MKLRLVIIWALLLSAVGCLGADAKAAETATVKGKILIVVTNHGTLGATDVPTGYFLAEVAHPWKVFREAGYAVDFASPKGGFAPMDPKSFNLEDADNRALWHDLNAVESLVHTRALGDLDWNDYAAIFFAGGHGTMWDFPDHPDVLDSIRTFYESDRPVGSVCHGPAALVNVRLSDGTYLVAGKRVNGFTNEEEEAVQLSDVVPFLLETKLRERGARFTESAVWQEHVAVDGMLVTGQNPASATETAEALIELLGKATATGQ
jgi:putative intracellular protease/amidase